MTARVRIGTIRTKSGGELRLLPPSANADRTWVERAVREALDGNGSGPIGGFAFVVWDADLGISCAQKCFTPGNIPTPLIPDFVRARLMLATAAQWGTEDTLDVLGFTPETAS